MKPVVFTIPGIGWDIPGYGLMMMIAFLTSIWWATRRAEKSGANPEVILNVGFLALIGGVVGCRAMFVIHYWDQFASRGSVGQIIWAILDVTRGGLEFYGGLLLCIPAALLWLRYVEKVSIRWYMDIIAPSVVLGLAIGRIGCFLNGCCYGGPCELPWAVQFPYASPPANTQWERGNPEATLPQELLYTHQPGLTMPISREAFRVTEGDLAKLDAQRTEFEAKLKDKRGQVAAAGAADRPALEKQEQQLEAKAWVARYQHSDLRNNMARYGLSLEEMKTLAAEHPSPPLHPTQLYSTITALLVALLLDTLYWRRTRDGQVILAMLAIEPVTRWVIEVIRTDNPTDTLGVFTISQGLALSMTVIGIVGLLALRSFPPRSPRAVVFEPEDEEADAPPSAQASA